MPGKQRLIITSPFLKKFPTVYWGMRGSSTIMTQSWQKPTYERVKWRKRNQDGIPHMGSASMLMCLPHEGKWKCHWGKEDGRCKGATERKSVASWGVHERIYVMETGAPTRKDGECGGLPCEPWEDLCKRMTWSILCFKALIIVEAGEGESSRSDGASWEAAMEERDGEGLQAISELMRKSGGAGLRRYLSGRLIHLFWLAHSFVFQAYQALETQDRWDTGFVLILLSSAYRALLAGPAWLATYARALAKCPHGTRSSEHPSLFLIAFFFTLSI